MPRRNLRKLYPKTYEQMDLIAIIVGKRVVERQFRKQHVRVRFYSPGPGDRFGRYGRKRQIEEIKKALNKMDLPFISVEINRVCLSINFPYREKEDKKNPVTYPSLEEVRLKLRRSAPKQQLIETLGRAINEALIYENGIHTKDAKEISDRFATKIANYIKHC